MVSAKTPTIANIKNRVSLDDVRALLSIAICEVCDFFNVGKNMNDSQIALTVDLIIERFWYFKLEEVKYCFRRAMMRDKLFDRLDGNIIIGWLREYDNERTEEAMRISEREEAEAYNAHADSLDAIDYNQYLIRLEERAKKDESAARLLASIKHPTGQRLTMISREEREKRDHDFEIWRVFEYLPGKEKNE